MLNKLVMKDFVVKLLKDNLSKEYFYHNLDHTLYVTEKVFEIGGHENCTEEELELLHTAALWHDTGYLNAYKNHEEQSCLLARKYLPEYDFSSAKINEVCNIIMATKIPQSANTKLEKIMADADLEYLGTASFHKKSDLLFKEVKLINPSLNPEKWDDVQISFLKNHHYFTNFCIRIKEPVKQMHLQELIEKGNLSL